jgi:hypothetical protein
MASTQEDPNKPPPLIQLSLFPAWKASVHAPLRESHVAGSILAGHERMENPIGSDQAETVGLNINTNKTKSVVQMRKQWRDKVIHLNNTDIEIVDSFMYLGSIMNTNNDEITEVERRMLMTKRADCSIIRLFKSMTIHQKNKIRIYKTIV